MKVVINGCYGGFGLSELAKKLLKEKGCFFKYDWRDIKRSDPGLVEVVELLGEAADGPHASLHVVEIPDDVDWEIDEYDGWEKVVERHKSWE